MSQFPIIFGLVAAMAHVLAGPDHLAAVAPLALDRKFKSWMIGMSWGVGHLIGMLLIGILFFFFRELIPVDFISENSEKIVGGLLIVIGIWALMRLAKHNWKPKHKHVHAHTDEEGNAIVHYHDHDHGHTSHHEHTHKTLAKQTYLAALGIGILHGLAGVSHIIHMMPTLAFPSRYESGMYLLGFGIGTVLAMVLFSAILGLIARYSSQQKNALIYKSINALAGIAAIVVGLYWLWSTW